MGDVTSDGKRLIDAWLAAKESAERAEDQLNRARCDVHNAASDLAKWMLPEDAKCGEKIAIWHGDALIQVELRSIGEPILTIRASAHALHAALR